MNFINQTALFAWVWRNRKHECEVCKDPLLRPEIWYFAHILGKGAYPFFKLRAKNIAIMCDTCHGEYDHTDRWATSSMFDGIKKRRQRLMEQYNWYFKNDLVILTRINNIFRKL